MTHSVMIVYTVKLHLCENFSLDDAERTGRLRTSAIKANFTNVRKILDEDRQVTPAN